MSLVDLVKKIDYNLCPIGKQKLEKCFTNVKVPSKGILKHSNRNPLFWVSEEYLLLYLDPKVVTKIAGLKNHSR